MNRLPNDTRFVLVHGTASRQSQDGPQEALLTFIVSSSDPLSYGLGTVCILMTLALAWRAYRFSIRESQQRKIARHRHGGR
jgi:hypothetical protein